MYDNKLYDNKLNNRYINVFIQSDTFCLIQCQLINWMKF